MHCTRKQYSIENSIGFEGKTEYSGGDGIKICLITGMLEFITFKIMPQLYIYGVSFKYYINLWNNFL